MVKRYEIVEHHFDFRSGREWEVPAGSVTNLRKTVAKLADQRRSGEMPETLSHWTVGDYRVYGQSASTLGERQGF